jgi:hypothetical protein
LVSDFKKFKVDRIPTFIGKQQLYRESRCGTVYITKTSAGKIATGKIQKHIPNVTWFSTFFRKKEHSLFGKNLVITGKKFWTFPESSRPFSEIFPFYPGTTVCSGKTFQTFSGI